MAMEYKFDPNGKYIIGEKINNENVRKIMSGNATTRDRKSLVSDSRWRGFVKDTLKQKSKEGFNVVLSDTATLPEVIYLEAKSQEENFSKQHDDR